MVCLVEQVERNLLAKDGHRYGTSCIEFLRDGFLVGVWIDAETEGTNGLTAAIARTIEGFHESAPVLSSS